MKIAIIQYNAGNTQSLYYALQRIGFDAQITNQPNEIFAADKVLFPGQGEASSAMAYLKKTGLDQTLIHLKKPVLGICLGMQLLFDHSEEANTQCLGLLPYTVKKISPKVKIPQIGWNKINQLQGPLFENIKESEYVYYANSYVVELVPQTIAITNYPTAFSAAIQFKNFYGIQFHPEKSGMVGEQILKNFLNNIV